MGRLTNLENTILLDFRFFEIYRSSEYLNLLFEGILISSSLTAVSGLLGFIIAILAYLDLKAAPFFIIWVVSYYLDV